MRNRLTVTFWTRRWLQLAVLALAISGVFSIILVFARTPQLIENFPWMKELFSVSLVIHVDLSVLVWFLAMTGVMWTLLPRTASVLPFADGAGWGAVLLGVLLMAASPLTGEWTVIKSNYIPVITNGLFFIGLGLIAAGMVSAMLSVSASLPKKDQLIEIGIYATVPVLAIALTCFALSASGMPPEVRGHTFYEHVFWGGGHVLQFVYIQAMLVAWLVLATELGLRAPPKPLLLGVLLVGPLSALYAFVPYMQYGVMSGEHLAAFSLLMNVAMGIGGGMLGLWYVGAMLFKGIPKGAYGAALLTSFMLFIVGGAFGAAIEGQNVKIPAHYHGSIVAVTLALMGFAYWLLPRLGGADVSRWRMARFQPWLYGVGQLMHITGLAWSGGYGVLRKTAGYSGEMTPQLKAAFGLIGGGGLLAIIGGLLFVVVMVKGFRRCHVVANVG